MKFLRKTFFFIAGVALMSACEPKMDEFVPSAGSADFSHYVSVGNSLTSGYADGELYKAGQINSYPNLIAAQFKLAGGGDFKQPLMFDDLGFGQKRILALVQSVDCDGKSTGASPSLSPVMAGGTPDPRNFGSIAAGGPYNNIGVPGAKSFHLLVPGYAKLNPYYGRFANSGTSTVLSEAKRVNPTFFTLWIGNNDVLGYATSGGEGDNITDAATFAGSLSQIIDSLTHNGAKGAVANIPDVTSIPFFNTVPYNALVLTNQADVDMLNAAYHNGAFGINFKLGQNAFVIADATVPVIHMRQMVSGEMILLTIPQDSLRCARAGWGSRKPIPGKYVLDHNEASLILTATQGFNATLATLASAKGLALVDMNSNLHKVKTGLAFDGMKFNTLFISGGTFSLDGVHLSPRGNAVVANFFIEAINAKYNAHVPLVTVGDLPGIIFP
jgi:hypothetical protein